MIRRDEVYKIGKLGKPHGVKGEITFAITDEIGRASCRERV